MTTLRIQNIHYIITLATLLFVGACSNPITESTATPPETTFAGTEDPNLEANQGGLYIVENSDEEDERHIKLASCYAYKRRKFVKQKIAIGEGLLGQAYLERKTVFMSDVPESYVRITSGLGKATPRSIVIVPLLINEQVEGLFELASFRAFESHQLDFLKDLGESIASAVVNHRITLNTRRLLEQTR